MTPDILKTIDRFWEARIAGDKAAVRSFIADGCTFEMVGAKAFADGSLVGPTSADQAVDRLLDSFECRDRTCIDSIVDGHKAAVTNRLEVSYRGGPPVTTEACDLWEFDSSGKVKSLRQFVDTSLVNSMMSGQA